MTGLGYPVVSQFINRKEAVYSMIVIFELFVKIIGAKKNNTELAISFEMQRNVRLTDKKKANLQET